MIYESIRKLEYSDGCNKIFCTTCGGIFGKLERGYFPELKSQISNDLKDCRLKDLVRLGNDWLELISSHFWQESRFIIRREEELLNRSNVRDVDYYLFYARKLSRTETYNEIFEEALNFVFKSKDESLLETILITLGKGVLKHDSLLELALDESKKSNTIKAVLYNNIRYEVKEVRDYIGDGTSVAFW